MLQADRHKKILDIIEEEQVVKTIDLSQRLHTTRQTIHSDIDFLHQQGKLTAVRGGAIQRKTSEEDSALQRRKHNNEAKDLIGYQAAELVDDGDTIFIDMGTTVLAMLPYLENKKNLHIITSSIEIAYELAIKDKHRLFVIGGQLRNSEFSLSGNISERILKEFYVDKAFIGAGGVSKQAGLTDYHLQEAQIRRIMLENARLSYVLVDSSKHGIVAVSKFAELTDIDAIISERFENKPLLNFLDSNNIAYYLADSKE